MAEERLNSTIQQGSGYKVGGGGDSDKKRFRGQAGKQNEIGDRCLGCGAKGQFVKTCPKCDSAQRAEGLYKLRKKDFTSGTGSKE